MISETDNETASEAAEAIGAEGGNGSEKGKVELVPRSKKELRDGPLRRAFEAMEFLPASLDSWERVYDICRWSPDNPMVGSLLLDAVASDMTITLGVMRAANAMPGATRGRVRALSHAVDLLGPTGIEKVVKGMPAVDLFERCGPWDVVPERFRLHALECQRVAGRLAQEVDWPSRDDLMTTALLQNLGSLALWHAFPRSMTHIARRMNTPENRVTGERAVFRTDHAEVSAVLLRRWGLPQRMATVVHRHHEDELEGEPALLKLCDMIAHYTRGEWLPPTTMVRPARAVGIERARLRTLLIELSGDGGEHQRRIERCTLTDRERQVLQGLADGKVYKQIGAELGLASSTVRTHLYNIYCKLGVHDRARAVLIATSHGWLNS